jgi:hypothetical protein
MGHDTFKAGDLTAVIGDNEAHEGHHAGFNGVHELLHRTAPRNLFVPGYVGLNFEHIFEGDRDLRDKAEGGPMKTFFEPRHAPMEFRRVSDVEAELHWPPTPAFKLESRTRFTVVAPHYLDVEFRCTPTQHAFRNGYIGLFWASYINGPDDKSLYFRREGRWHQHCTPEHDNQSTVRHKDDAFEPKFAEGITETLYKNFSPLRYDEPFYYGNFGGHIFILMFDRAEGIRFAHSPSGGGDAPEFETTCPAWDWQFLIPDYEVLREYGFRARVAYRERCPRSEILAEVARWKESLDR